MIFDGAQMEWMAEGVNIKPAEPKKSHHKTKPAKKNNNKL